MTLNFCLYPLTFKLLLLNRKIKIFPDEDFGTAGCFFYFIISEGL
jgi:hypothetical protein